MSPLDAPPAISAPIEEVIVTSSRRQQAARSEPASVARIEAEALNRLSADQPLEALRQLPGVGFQQNNGVENLPAIRSPVLTGGAAAGSILFLEDGVPIRAPGFGNVNQSFETNTEIAAAIEVTRGPGAAVYGSNALNGVVNVLTPRARATQGVAIELEAGRFGRRYGEAIIGTGPVLLTVSALDDGGYRQDAGVDLQKVVLGVDQRLGVVEISWRATVQNLAQETAGFIVDPEGFRDRDLAQSNPTPSGFRDQILVRSHVSVDWSLGRNLELQLTPFGRWIDTELALSFFPSQALEETGQFGGGVLSSLYWQPSDTVSLQIGVDADRSQGRLRETQTLPSIGTFVQGVHYDFVVDSLAIAAFVQADVRFASRWRAVFGARAERVTFDYVNQAADGDLGRFRRPGDRKDGYNALSPKFGLSRAVGENGLAFVSYRRGARPPQATDLYALQTQQTPGEGRVELLDQVEGGLRWRLPRAGRIELVGYWAERIGGSFRNADGLTVTDARTRGRGLEISYRLPLLKQLSLEGWVAHAAHTYRFVDPATAPANRVAFGAEIDTAPRWLAQTALEWRPHQRLGLNLAWRRVGGYFLDSGNTERQDGFNVLDVSGQFQMSPNLALVGGVRNALDARFPERADFAFGSRRFFPGEPIAFRVGLHAKL